MEAVPHCEASTYDEIIETLKSHANPAGLHCLERAYVYREELMELVDEL